MRSFTGSETLRTIPDPPPRGVNNMSFYVEQKQPKYKFGDTVSINGMGKYTVRGVEAHGCNEVGAYCDCCRFADKYFMYQVSQHGWINESELKAI